MTTRLCKVQKNMHHSPLTHMPCKHVPCNHVACLAPSCPALPPALFDTALPSSPQPQHHTRPLPASCTPGAGDQCIPLHFPHQHASDTPRPAQAVPRHVPTCSRCGWLAWQLAAVGTHSGDSSSMLQWALLAAAASLGIQHARLCLWLCSQTGNCWHCEGYYVTCAAAYVRLYCAPVTFRPAVPASLLPPDHMASVCFLCFPTRSFYPANRCLDVSVTSMHQINDEFCVQATNKI